MACRVLIPQSQNLVNANQEQEGAKRVGDRPGPEPNEAICGYQYQGGKKTNFVTDESLSEKESEQRADDNKAEPDREHDR